MSANAQYLFNPDITAEPVVIQYLADCPQHIPTLAAWIYDYWGKQYRMHSVREQIDAISERLYRNRIPLAFVALSGSHPIGTASLKIQEMTTRKQFYHWLGSVFVIPEFRRRGIGGALVTRCETKAAEFGVSDLFLHSPDQEAFYRKLNWIPVERSSYYDMQVVIMKKTLASPVFRGMRSYPESNREDKLPTFPRF